MGDYLHSASAILAQSERRVEVSSQNIANITTPGFKRRIDFSQLLTPADGASPSPVLTSMTTDFAPGKPIETGNPYDLAILGDGFFAVRSGDRILLTRQGQFQRDVNDRLITSQGWTLQAADGGDLVLKGQSMTVTADGTVLEAGEPVARIAISQVTEPGGPTDIGSGLFDAGDSDVAPVTDPQVRQGMLESSNVSMGDEMVTVMEALRRAEAGQRLVNVYDDLMGRALTAFGQT
jgi:flagellar basal-body rod protein FlgF